MPTRVSSTREGFTLRVASIFWRAGTKRATGAVAEHQRLLQQGTVQPQTWIHDVTSSRGHSATIHTSCRGRWNCVGIQVYRLVLCPVQTGGRNFKIIQQLVGVRIQRHHTSTPSFSCALVGFMKGADALEILTNSQRNGGLECCRRLCRNVQHAQSTVQYQLKRSCSRKESTTLELCPNGNGQRLPNLLEANVGDTDAMLRMCSRVLP